LRGAPPEHEVEEILEVLAGSFAAASKVMSTRRRPV